MARLSGLSGLVPSVDWLLNYLRALRCVQDQVRDPTGLSLSVRLLCDAHRLLLDASPSTRFSMATGASAAC